MESLRKIGDILKQHWEKFVLTLVLIGLALAVVYVYQSSQKERQKVEESVQEVINIKPKPVPPVDLTNATMALQSALKPREISFSDAHNLFNPGKWKQKADSTRYRTSEGDVWDKMVITRIEPLNFTITFDRTPNPGGYFLGVVNENAPRVVDRRKRQIFATMNVTNKFMDRLIVLREIKGPPEKPDELVLELADSAERVSVATNRPFSRIEGYEADLRHEIMEKPFPNLRVGSGLRLQNDDYKIVAINEKEVVASAQANDKKYTVRRFAQPTNAVIKPVPPPVTTPPPGTTAPPPPP